MTFTTAIGNFWFEQFLLGDNAMARIGTDAPINSPRATRHLNELCKGKGGIGEIDDVTVYDRSIVLTFREDLVLNEEKIKKLTKSFLLRLKTSVEVFDQIDKELWRLDANHHDFSEALAITSDIPIFTED